MRILIVGSNDGLRQHLKEALEVGGHEIQGEQSASSALTGLERAPFPDVVLLDHFSAGPECHRLARLLRKSPKLRTSRLVLITADETETAAEIAPDAVLQKPFDIAELEAVVDRFAP
jgi:CheY-like chemotaxis protein